MMNMCHQGKTLKKKSIFTQINSGGKSQREVCAYANHIGASHPKHLVLCVLSLRYLFPRGGGQMHLWQWQNLLVICPSAAPTISCFLFPVS